MVESKIAYPIAHWAGCDAAPLQALSTADRPLAAFVTAYAAHEHHTLNGGEPDTTSLRGALMGSNHATVRKWIDDNCAHFNLPRRRVSKWTGAINGRRIEFDDDDIRPLDGLMPDPYQILAMRSATSAGAGLAMGVGLGKTLTACSLATIAARRQYANGSRLWIFCPLNAFDAWDRFLPSLREVFVDVRVLSIDSAHKYIGAENCGGVIIFDEVHMAGDKESRRTVAAHTVRALFDFAICLTGTLNHAGVEKCLSVLDLVTPGMALFATRWKAGEHFHCLVRKNIGPRTVTELLEPTGDSFVLFNEWLARAVISLDKHSPEVQADVHIPEQELHTVDFGKPWPPIAEEVGRIAGEIFEAEGELPHIQRVIHRICRAGIEQKMDWISENIDDPSMGIVIFAQYRDSLDYAGQRLEAAGLTYVRVDGDISKEDRPALNAAFQSGAVNIFLGQTLASGIAINLFRTNVSIMLDHSWKAVEYTQALGRTCRRGQTHVCHHFDLYSNSVQKKIIDRVRAGQNFDASCTEYQALKRAGGHLPRKAHDGSD